MPQNTLTSVDWSSLPEPHDDGAAHHLAGAQLPNIHLDATDGSRVAMAELTGRTIFFVYPMTGQPGASLPAGWDGIPGARGCTPQSCAFRDYFAELRAAGADRVFGLSTQDTNYQREAVERLHLPFALLSDAKFEFADALQLPRFTIGAVRYLKRMTLIVDGASVSKVFYPVFPPDRNASDVLAYLQETAK